MTTATEHRVKAEAAESRAAESFDRCDTDGWATQAASDLTAQKHHLAAEIAEQGGTWEFPALFDLSGNLIAAKLINGRYGMVWGILASDDAQGAVAEWFSPSKARNEATARRNNAAKGYYIGSVKTEAVAILTGSGQGFAGLASVSAMVWRPDHGFSRDVEIVDNGQ